jgi:hypothetical protein
MAAPVQRLDTILATLREHGPMTSVEIAEIVGWSSNSVSRSISKARGRKPGAWLRITRWQQQVGRWAMPHPVYSAHGGADAERDLPTPQEMKPIYQKRYRDKYPEILRAKARIRDRKRRGAVVQPNHWASMFPGAIRASMAQAAANTSTLTKAA